MESGLLDRTYTFAESIIKWVGTQGPLLLHLLFLILIIIVPLLFLLSGVKNLKHMPNERKYKDKIKA